MEANLKLLGQQLDGSGVSPIWHGSPTYRGLEHQCPCWIPWSHLASAPSKEYSVRSAYDGFFQGSVSFGPWAFGRVGLRVNAASCGWRPTTNVGRLTRWLARVCNMPPCCPLCNQEGETINHLLVACVYSLQFWFGLLQTMGLLNLSPQSREFPSMAGRINEGVIGQVRQGLNSIIILRTWTIVTTVFFRRFTKPWEHHVVLWGFGRG